MGLGNNSHIIHLIDYGLSMVYMDSGTMTHTSITENQFKVGTARFMSLNAHLGIT